LKNPNRNSRFGFFVSRLSRGIKLGIAIETSRAIQAREFTSIIERDGNWFIVQCPGVAEANGQGQTAEEAKSDLAASYSVHVRRSSRGRIKAASADALSEVVTIEK